ncbi:MAG TPA: tRNA lysidine(34) synthetase TilS [Syntrophomonadaceae bacterium]|nr:tRNA lysidine(34) synthetase TilS [Syntrophomonadaceae bacterium]
MLNKIENFISTHHLVESGELVVVGVSGGPDSMALLHILVDLSPRLGFRIAAAHLNHGLRPEADEEEAFVREACRKLEVACFTQKVAVEELARARKAGLEETGRYARYNFFEELRQQIGGHRIATAHHSDDVAESVLLHLLRGSGIKGLRGILPLNGLIIRPLLRVSKQELLQYLELKLIPYCRDESNSDPYYLRNRIRHKLIPLLEKEFNPRIVDKLNQLATIAGDENQVMEEQTQMVWNEVRLAQDSSTVVVDNRVLTGLPRGFQRRIVLKALNQLATTAEWSLEDVEAILALSAREKVGSALNLHLKRGVRVNKSYDTMVFTIQPAVRTQFKYELPVPGKVAIPELGQSYRVSLVVGNDYVPGPDVTGLDFECLPQPLWLRSRQNGDYYVPPGFKGRKKLKKCLAEARIPYNQRDQVVLVTGDGHEVYAALGLFIADKAVVGSHTRLVLRIESSPMGTTTPGHTGDRLVE